MAGAFQTSREIFENSIWQNVVEFRMFFLIYGKAIFSEEGYKVGNIILKRGQWLRSFRNLQSDLEFIENRAVKKYSLSTIKRAVDNLSKQERISTEDTELGTLFTVINYSVYQGFEVYKIGTRNAERTQSEQQANTDRTESERRANNNKNVKKVKNENKINNYSDEFEKFWNECPNKKSKGEAFKKFSQVLVSGITSEKLIESMKAYSKEMQGKEARFIKHPSTWLNQECWNDEYGNNSIKRGDPPITKFIL